MLALKACDCVEEKLDVCVDVLHCDWVVESVYEALGLWVWLEVCVWLREAVGDADCVCDALSV